MYNKAIILYTSNYTLKVKSFFSIDYLIENGVDVEYWDLSKVTCHEFLSPAQSNLLEIKQVNDLSEFEALIKSNIDNQCLYLTFMMYAYYSKNIFRILSRYHVDLLTGANGVLMNIVKEGFHSRSVSIFSIKKILKGIRTRADSALLNTRLYISCKYRMSSCRKSVPEYKTSNSTITIPCNSGDYEVAMSVKKDDKCLPKEKFILFLDQYIPFHNDYKMSGLNTFEPDFYYNKLCAYLSKVEQKYGCSVVIAAHPSAMKYKENNYFDGRRVFFNKTAELSFQASGIITHYSTALSFAVVFNKPILLLDIKGFSKEYEAYIQSFKRHLNVAVESIDGDICTFNKIDKEKYHNYIDDYLKSPDNDGLTNGEIILNIMKGNLN